MEKDVENPAYPGVKVVAGWMSLEDAGVEAFDGESEVYRIEVIQGPAAEEEAGQGDSSRQGQQIKEITAKGHPKEVKQLEGHS